VRYSAAILALFALLAFQTSAIVHADELQTVENVAKASRSVRNRRALVALARKYGLWEVLATVLPPELRQQLMAGDGRHHHREQHDTNGNQTQTSRSSAGDETRRRAFRQNPCKRTIETLAVTRPGDDDEDDQDDS
jgi:hypothetical protein